MEKGLHKSKFHDGIRYRYLSRNHSQYWRQIPYTEEVESWYRVPIYTIEQADKLGLDPSENWRISPDGEPKHLNANSYYWPDDYVVTVLGPGIQPWVMPKRARGYLSPSSTGAATASALQSAASARAG